MTTPASERRRHCIIPLLHQIEGPMTDSEFIAMADRVLARIGDALDAGDADVDWQLNDGILEIDCAGGDGSGGKIIVNRHVPNREIWLAAKGGGYHFRPVDGRWLDTRGTDDLVAALSRALKEQAGVELMPGEVDLDLGSSP
jgi:CyaY protein